MHRAIVNGTLTALAVMAFAVTPVLAAAPDIDKLLQAYVAALNAKDATKAASFYAEDGVLMFPDAPLVKGRTNVQAFLKQLLPQIGVVKLAPPLQSEISGAHAFSAGNYTVTSAQGTSLPLTGAEGSGSVSFPAKYLVVFKRVGNDWKIAYEMVNTDQPPAAPPR